MAEGPDRDQKTEAASPRRLQQARDEGQVAIGQDALHLAGLAGALLALVAGAGSLRGGLAAMLGQAAASVDATPFARLPGLAAGPAAGALAICACAGAGAAVAAVAQTRGGFWPSRVAPDLSRLVQGGRIGRVFQKDFLLDLVLAITKVGALAGAAWWGVAADVALLPALLWAEPGDQLGRAFGMLARAARPVLAVALLLALADLALQRWRFAVKLRMTREETKREMKEEDGDPLVRGQRKRRHRDLLRNRANLEVPRADALVVNPTHVAVAIRYRRDEGRAPRVTAKGKGALAEHMRALAREHGVPIHQDVPLARLLYRKVRVGREIPAQTYQAVAAVLAFVYRVTGRRAAAVERRAP